MKRGLKVDHSTINRWVIHYSPQLEESFRKRYKRPVGESLRMDEEWEGNPPIGSYDKRTRFRHLLELHAEELISVLVNQAKNGDPTALKLTWSNG